MTRRIYNSWCCYFFCCGYVVSVLSLEAEVEIEVKVEVAVEAEADVAA